MIQVYNTSDNVYHKNKKKKNFRDGVYRETIKQLCKEIRNYDFGIIARIDIHCNYDIGSDVSKMVLEIYRNENIKYNDVKNMFKNLYNKYGVRNLLLLYLVTFKTSMTRANIEKIYNENNLDVSNNEKIDIDEFEKIDRIIATMTLLPIVLEYDLLNHQISTIVYDSKKRRMNIKTNIKSENVSILKGVNGIPFLIGSKEKIVLSGVKINIIDLYRDYNMSDDGINYVSENFGNIFYQRLLVMLCLGKDFPTFSTCKFEDYKDDYENKDSATINFTARRISLRVLKTRKILPPENGIILRVKNHENIESIYLNETTFLDKRILYGVVRYKNETENIFSEILDKALPFITVYTKFADDVVSIILKFYNVDLNMLGKNAKYQDFDFDILSPIYWKYRNNNYETDNEKQIRLKTGKIEKEHLIKVSNFIRNIKGNPSKDAIALADKCCIELEPNTTIVKEHFRSYKRYS